MIMLRRLKLQSIADVAASQMCCGCGVCAYASPEAIEMVDDLDQGRRPLVREGASPNAEALAACPGVGLTRPSEPAAPDRIDELLPAWGPVLEVLEGYATDSEIRFAGSSGGALTAIALFCLEQSGFRGVLHIAARKDHPFLNHTVLSTHRSELLAATGSRYAPASPCDGLKQIEDAGGPCVFIGKPCDVAGARMISEHRPGLAQNLGLTLGFFCAGTPTTRGTLEMIRAMGIDDVSTVRSVRYRGRGWPGKATVTDRGTGEHTLSYEQSWGEILQKHRQWRCHVCADHTGELADLAFGDPWHRPIAEGEPGRSLILVRTERGRRILHAAIAAGYLTARRADPSILPRSQPNLLKTRGAVWGRIQMLKLLGAAAPKFRGMPMFRIWRSELSLKEKAQSLYGTLKRVFSRKLRRRAEIAAFDPKRSRDLVAHFVPRWPLNPYHFELSRHLAGCGVRVDEEGSLKRIARKVGASGNPRQILHLHELPRFAWSPVKLARLAMFWLRIIHLKRRGARVVWTVHDGLHHETLHPHIDSLIGKMLYRRADAIIFHSDGARCAVEEEWKTTPQAPSFVIPHGNYSSSYPNRTTQRDAREKLRVPPDRTVFLYLGLIRPYKGVPPLIDTFKRLPQREAYLLVAGKPVSAELAREIDRRVAGSESVQFHSGLVGDDQMQDYFNAADVVVFPYTRALTSGALILAMSFGRACIAPRLGGLMDALNENGGYLYDPTDRGALYDSLEAALEDRSRLTAMGEYNRRRALEWRWDEAALKTAGVYRQCLEGQS
jgi:coenzyme F420 hydrogenase subunit beta